jgi:hypothetical protein
VAAGLELLVLLGKFLSLLRDSHADDCLQAIVLQALPRTLIPSCQPYSLPMQWPSSHSCYDPHHALDTNEPYAFEYTSPCEPYPIALKAALPKFDLRWRGRVLDKVSYITQMAALGTHFFANPSVFMMHLPHPDGVPLKERPGDRSDPVFQDFWALPYVLMRVMLEDLRKDPEFCTDVLPHVPPLSEADVREAMNMPHGTASPPGSGCSNSNAGRDGDVHLQSDDGSTVRLSGAGGQPSSSGASHKGNEVAARGGEVQDGTSGDQSNVYNLQAKAKLVPTTRGDTGDAGKDEAEVRIAGDKTQTGGEERQGTGGPSQRPDEDDMELSSAAHNASDHGEGNFNLLPASSQFHGSSGSEQDGRPSSVIEDNISHHDVTRDGSSGWHNETQNSKKSKESLRGDTGSYAQDAKRLAPGHKEHEKNAGGSRGIPKAQPKGPTRSEGQSHDSSKHKQLPADSHDKPPYEVVKGEEKKEPSGQGGSSRDGNLARREGLPTPRKREDGQVKSNAPSSEASGNLLKVQHDKKGTNDDSSRARRAVMPRANVDKAGVISDVHDERSVRKHGASIVDEELSDAGVEDVGDEDTEDGLVDARQRKPGPRKSRLDVGLENGRDEDGDHIERSGRDPVAPPLTSVPGEKTGGKGHHKYSGSEKHHGGEQQGEDSRRRQKQRRKAEVRGANVIEASDTAGHKGNVISGEERLTDNRKDPEEEPKTYTQVDKGKVSTSQAILTEQGVERKQTLNDQVAPHKGDTKKKVQMPVPDGHGYLKKVQQELAQAPRSQRMGALAAASFAWLLLCYAVYRLSVGGFRFRQ